jgi:ABC-type spermidine/putrescine transport system permease subunit II
LTNAEPQLEDASGQLLFAAVLSRLLSGVWWLLFVAAYIFLYLPLAVTGLFSFNSSTIQALPLEGFTTSWYRALFHDASILDAVKTSVIVACSAVAIGVVTGTAFAFAFDRIRFRGQAIVAGLFAIPAILPGMVLGLSMAITFHTIGLQASVFTIVLGHMTFVTPIIFFIVLARLRRLDPSLEHASMDCGANRSRTFIHVTLPEIRGALLGAALIGFTLSFDEIIVTFFLAGSRQTLPVYVWNQLRFGFTPEINAVFTCISVGSVTLVIVATRLLTRREPGHAGQTVVDDIDSASIVTP